jgi:hypothetical protein
VVDGEAMPKGQSPPTPKENHTMTVILEPEILSELLDEIESARTMLGDMETVIYALEASLGRSEAMLSDLINVPQPATVVAIQDVQPSNPKT